jgi:hypothetical protein
MTRDEWEGVSFLAYGEWWDAPQSDQRMNAWYPMLSEFSASEVQQALVRLLRVTPTFAPGLGALLSQLASPIAAFDDWWPKVFKILGRVSATYHGEEKVVAAVQDECGPEVAGWVALYGPKRLSMLEVNGEHGGIELARLQKSYSEQMAEPRSRAKAVEAARLMLKELRRKELGQGDGS